MKLKAFAGIMATLFLVIALFSAIPVRVGAAENWINIGIIGPYGLPHWEPAGMWPAAEMAVKEINTPAAGGTGSGINIGGTIYNIKLFPADEHALPVPSPEAAKAEMVKLITVDGCDIIIGGFRTEVTTTMIEVAMDYEKIFIINGASTTELIYETVVPNYARYKYLFRTMPQNSTALVKTIMGYLSYYLMPLMLPRYGVGGKIPYAVVTEDLAWTALIHYLLTDPTMREIYLPYGDMVYAGRIPETATDCSFWLNEVKDKNARLMIHIFSGRPGLPLIIQWRDMGIKAVPLGINVLGQLEDHWSNTLGKCEYEAILNPCGTGTPMVPGLTDVFWDKFVTETGKWPLYVAFGAYDTLFGVKENLEAAGSFDPNNLAALIPTMEATDRMSMMGRFKHTGPDGKHHDVYATSFGPTWDEQWSRGCQVQWQKHPTTGEARMEVVSPVNMPWSKKFKFLPWTYPAGKESLAETDLDCAGGSEIINIDDVNVVLAAWLTAAGETNWDLLADMDGNDFINIRDVAKVAMDWMKTVNYPL